MVESEKMISLSEPTFLGPEKQRVMECIDSGWVASGPWTQQFEEDVVRYLQSDIYGCSVVSGSAALYLALKIVGVKPGDLVVVPTLTFAATVNAVVQNGAEPVFIDCDEHLNLSVEGLQQFLETRCEKRDQWYLKGKQRIAALMAVDILGHPADWVRMKELVGDTLPIVEDAAEAFGSWKKVGDQWQACGTLGDISCFSFNGNKIITAGGGGMILSKNQEWIDRARYLANQAKDDSLYFIHGDAGFNFRLSNLHAAFACGQLESLEQLLEGRKRVYEFYKDWAKDQQDLEMVQPPVEDRSNHWLSAVVLDPGIEIDPILQHMIKNSVEARPLWTPLHLLKPFQKYEFFGSSLLAEKMAKRVLLLPSSSHLQTNDLEKVVRTLEQAVRSAKS